MTKPIYSRPEGPAPTGVSVAANSLQSQSRLPSRSELQFTLKLLQNQRPNLQITEYVNMLLKEDSRLAVSVRRLQRQSGIRRTCFEPGLEKGLKFLAMGGVAWKKKGAFTPSSRTYRLLWNSVDH